MNNYFINITKNLDLKPSAVSNTSDIDPITKHFDDNISVCKIKQAYSEIIQEDNFSFKMVSMDEVKKVVLKLNSKKSSTYGAIPASILKQTIEVHLKYLTNSINHSLKVSTFPDELKQSEAIKTKIYIKNLTLYRRRIIDQRFYYRTYQKPLREKFTSTLIILWKAKSQNVSRVSENHMALNIL